MTSFQKIAKAFGWFLLTFGIIFLLLSFVVLLEKENMSAFYGMLMFFLFFGGPGFVILWRLSKLEKKVSFEQQVMGFLKSHKRFSLIEISSKFKKNPNDAEKFLFDIIYQDNGIDLFFHGPSRQYVHKSVLDEEYKIIKNCDNCGANLPNLIAFKNDKIECQYCGNMLTPHF